MPDNTAKLPTRLVHAHMARYNELSDKLEKYIRDIQAVRPGMARPEIVES